ncbi:uncharacterized protein BDW43DRAFT_283119 [Aspergillus alliaceus]|uniref:uncharacterized protein n=1 Tax=Petromyces alliaceus TaxID=209559 RepID=UPI0012A753E0|nr:uncharacterized protein BDW43DRAFT_283119 [Aspergillus alliaceus]KAB8231235.1 hypothetical protein BDW43DRAFT_283119 [Aspergillus alliaceus]
MMSKKTIVAIPQQSDYLVVGNDLNTIPSSLSLHAQPTTGKIIVLNGFPGTGKLTILKQAKELLPADTTILMDNHLLIDPVTAVIPDRSDEHHELRRKFEGKQSRLTIPDDRKLESKRESSTGGKGGNCRCRYTMCLPPTEPEHKDTTQMREAETRSHSSTEGTHIQSNRFWGSGVLGVSRLILCRILRDFKGL